MLQNLPGLTLPVTWGLWYEPMPASILETSTEGQMLTIACPEAGVTGEQGGVRNGRGDLGLTHCFCDGVQAELRQNVKAGVGGPWA